ncbi:MAG TPA: adenylate/guanylate cyclase domain-containing protein [Burkholderiales bacterium]|jgi:class 3 adenylate cyclase|nr:adenylate/guanylate cyclase domain-containing protein [Burkholderiales bacterium]
MSTPPVKRKLAAILAADAVGYSRAMATDEEGTVRILAAHRAVIDGIIQFHEGRIVNTAGDSVIAEFASPTQAVRCAVEIQDALKTRNDSLPEDKQMQFRIGVNLGDVMVKGEDLLGDGVNVAARLESIAEPGGIYVASSVYDQIAGKLDLGFSDLGEQSLKNIDRPVRAYRVDRDKRATPVAARKKKSSPMPWIAAGLAVVAVGGGATWYVGQQSAARQAEEGKAKADVDAAKARADAELAKARAEAEEAKKTAAAATDSAAAAKRALEEQRTAEQLARAQAQVAAARADAEATRRKADAEVAAATEARRSAEAAAKAAVAQKVAASPARSYAGPWAGTWSCSGGNDIARTFPAIVTYSGKQFDVQANKPGQPGFRQLIGVPQPDGNLRLTGQALGDPKNGLYPASVDGKFTGERYEGRGKFLNRDCVLAFARGTAQPAAAAAPATQGAWSGLMACVAFGSEGAREWPMSVAINGDKVEARGGKSGQPGWLEMAGVRKTDGTMRLTGAGLSGMKEYLGNSFKADFDGRFAGERYTGKGKLGTRECMFTIARK